MNTGFVIIDKPAGMTSHDVVAIMRRVADQREVGHTGTLDPFATGVLVLALGRATKFSTLIASQDKIYEGEITLGVATNTYDPEGEITAEGSIEGITEAQIAEAMATQVGTIDQMPPAFSAKKVKGKKLYEYARRGEEVEIEPKEVTIRSFDLGAWAPPVLRFTAEVSSGTYVRSMAHDLGQTLGCGGHLSRLVRTSVGQFSLRGAADLEALRGDPHLLLDHLIPVPFALPEIPQVTVSPEGERRLTTGSPAALAATDLPAEAQGASRLFAVSERGEALCLAEVLPGSVGTVRLQPKIQLRTRSR